jgi:prefoldin subunit 5
METNSKEKIIENIQKLENQENSVITKIRNKYISDLENYEAFVEKKIAKIDESINNFRDKIHYFEDPHNSIKTEFNKLWKKMSENKKCDDPMVKWIYLFLEFIDDSKIFIPVKI